MRQLKYRIEWMAASLLFTAFRLMPLDMASAVGGFMARSIGPFLRAHKIAKANLAMIFPDMKHDKKHALLMAMWDNLGRVAAELPHLPGGELYKRMTVENTSLLPPGQPAIFFSGHIGNWELNYPIAHNSGIPLTLIYREANNPYVDKMVSDIRLTQSSALIAKGARNSFKIIRAIKKGHALAMLVDQKMNEGIPIDFFGRPAMTAPAIAELSLRYDLPIIPSRIVRTRGCHFKAYVYPAIACEKTGDHATDVATIMTAINATLESWIRDHPEQWFWVHRRWPKE